MNKKELIDYCKSIGIDPKGKTKNVFFRRSCCFRFNNLEGKKTLIKNTIGSKPKTFEIDFLDNNNAIDIKWKDAITDGDHITKYCTRVKQLIIPATAVFSTVPHKIFIS